MKSDMKQLLKDFLQPPNTLFSGIFSNFHKYSVIKSYDKWRLVRFLFDEVLGFKIADQPIEKVNWEIPFIYKRKYYCSVAHQKFGFRIYVAEKNTKKADEIAKEIENVIENAIEASEPAIKQYASVALQKGEISIDNRIYELKEVYKYFKEEVLSRSKKMNKISASKSDVKNFKKQFELHEEISYLEQAGYVAFFSLLEHLCTLVLAFRNIPERHNIKDFAQKNWQDKFKLVFDLTQKEFKESYDYLLGVSRYKRNPSVHGLFDKLHSIFYFYLPSARHRISVGLYDKEISLQWKNEILNFDKLDSFLELLSRHRSTKRIMSYLNAGLNIVFGKHAENLDTFSDKEFDEFLKYQVYLDDNMGNMDW